MAKKINLKTIEEELFDKFKIEVLDDFIKSDHINKSYFGPTENKTWMSLTLYSCNKHYKESAYYYKGNLNFLHFSSQEKLKNIISSNTIRLYNLSEQNDPDEFAYAANLFSSTQRAFDDHKKQFFILSMCEENRENDLNLWRLYAEDTRGVCIKFEFVNDLDDWKGFHLSQLYYGPIEKIDNYKSKKKEFEEKNKFQFNLSLYRFLPFHKSENFEIENEIRLLFYKTRKNFFSHKVLKDENDIDNNKEYIQLELENNINGNQILPYNYEYSPKIRIKEIILGSNFKDEGLIEMVNRLLPDAIIKQSLLRYQSKR